MELKPCPFCGGEAMLIANPSIGIVYIQCQIDTETPMHECSVCGARVVKGLYEYENPNLYCYHCGAKMDGDVNA